MRLLLFLSRASGCGPKVSWYFGTARSGFGGHPGAKPFPHPFVNLADRYCEILVGHLAPHAFAVLIMLDCRVRSPCDAICPPAIRLGRGSTRSNLMLPTQDPAPVSPSGPSERH